MPDLPTSDHTLQVSQGELSKFEDMTTGALANHNNEGVVPRPSVTTPAARCQRMDLDSLPGAVT